MHKLLIFHLGLWQLSIAAENIFWDIVNRCDDGSYYRGKYWYPNNRCLEHEFISLEDRLIREARKIRQHKNDHPWWDLIQETIDAEHHSSWVTLAANHIWDKVYPGCKDHRLGDTNHHPQRIDVDLRLLGQNVEADWSSSLQKSTHYQSFSSTQNLGVKNWQLWSD